MKAEAGAVEGSRPQDRNKQKETGREQAQSALQLLERMEQLCRTAPAFSEMKQRTLDVKWMNGPTAAHVREEVHVPKNYAYVTFTTGTTAFQTPVGVVPEELPGRGRATLEILRRLGIPSGTRLLVTYAPLVAVFSPQALEEAGIRPVFLERSSRESLLLGWCRGTASVTAGESSFLRAALEDVLRLGLRPLLPKRMILLASGTPLDPLLPELLEAFEGWEVHDLYGCQEFGWLALDGVPLRQDLRLIQDPEEPELVYPAAGGLVIGDGFRRGKHCLNPEGTLATHARSESEQSWETEILSCQVESVLTARRAAKSILRMKSRIVRVSKDFVPEDRMRLRLIPGGRIEDSVILEGPEATELMDTFLEAQKRYQRNPKRDGTWVKR